MPRKSPQSDPRARFVGGAWQTRVMTPSTTTAQDAQDFPIVDSVPGVSAEALQSYIEEAERGYDVDSLPSIPNPISPSHIVPADLIERISERAARDNVSAEQ